MSCRHARGFTLVELVIVIVIAGALSTVLMQFITTPIDIFIDQSRRARLVDEAQSVMQKLAHDLRLAVPNSVRVSPDGRSLELMRAATGGRYRSLPPGDTLSFLPSDADTSFEALGGLTSTTGLVTSSDPAACANGTASCVVIYNTGFVGTDLWNGDNAATLTSLGGTPTVIGFDNSRFGTPPNAFPAQSPGQRFYLTDTAVSYLCDIGAGTLRRYWGYSHRANHADVDTDAELLALSNPAERTLMATRVSTCSFRYSPGTPSRNGILTVELSIADSGETITLLEQVGVSNLP